MISLRIKDTKVFMSQLLIKDTFDRMLLSEATIRLRVHTLLMDRLTRNIILMKNGIILIITKSLIQNGVILSHSVLVLLRVIKFLLL